MITLCDISVNGDYDGTLKVSIPVGDMYNDQTVTILHCRDGRLESLDVAVSNGVVTSRFDRLSPFAVFGTSINDVPVPQTGDNNTVLGLLMLSVALMMGVGALTAYRRKSRV